MPVGKAIAYNRNKSGLSQKELADMILCDQSMVAKLEAGVREPNATMIIAISEALKCTPNDLLGFSKKEQ